MLRNQIAVITAIVAKKTFLLTSQNLIVYFPQQEKFEKSNPLEQKLVH